MRLTLLFVITAGLSLAQDPLSTDAKNAWSGMKKLILRSAEKMPEENYTFKPVPEVRSYGQILTHIADAQYMICGAALGEKKEAQVEKTKSSKADITAALQDSTSFCDKAYDGLTDAKAAEMVKFFGRERPRLGVLQMNTSHTNEHYGNLVTYMRIKGIVPPSSEARKPM